MVATTSRGNSLLAFAAVLGVSSVGAMGCSAPSPSTASIGSSALERTTANEGLATVHIADTGALSVSPAAVDFGSIDCTEAPRSQSISVTNDSDATTLVRARFVGVGVADFSVTPGAVEVPAHGSAPFTVAMTYDDAFGNSYYPGTHTGSLQIESLGPDTSTATIQVSSTIRGVRISMVTSDVNLGTFAASDGPRVGDVFLEADGTEVVHLSVDVTEPWEASPARVDLQAVPGGAEQDFQFAFIPAHATQPGRFDVRTEVQVQLDSPSRLCPSPGGGVGDTGVSLSATLH